MNEQTPFDPTRYLTKVSGRDYLEVKWRLVWLRDAQPEARIETELVQHQGQHAIFRAKVTLPSGASATGWGSESISDFGDYLEKAETKALGRALAALGFGTQFTEDHSEGHRIVDSPVERGPAPNGPVNVRERGSVAPPAPRPGGRPGQSGQSGGGVQEGNLQGRHYPTVGQLKIARPVAQAAGLDWDRQANDIFFSALGVVTTNGTVSRNDAFNDVVEWMKRYEGASEGDWVYDGNATLIFGPDVGVPSQPQPPPQRQPTDPAYPDLDDVPFD